MPTLFLHVGQHKTGTTTLQKTFFDQRATLARQGLLYPETGLPDNATNWGHHELAYALRQPGQARTLWQALRDEADAAALPKVLVSSEELSLLPFPGLPHAQPFKLIAEVFKGYDLKLICYLRPQAEMIASLYNHNVKSVGEHRSILEFMAQITPRLEYQQYLNVAALGLGVEAIIVRRYQKPHLKNGDIVSDIAALMDVKPSRTPLEARTLNSGLTQEGLAEMLAANRRYAGDPARLKTARKQIIAKHRAPAFYRHDLLSPEACALIEALYRNKNRLIARRFLKKDEELFSVEL